jgi:hypothetical protein
MNRLTERVSTFKTNLWISQLLYRLWNMTYVCTPTSNMTSSLSPPADRIIIGLYIYIYKGLPTWTQWRMDSNFHHPTIQARKLHFLPHPNPSWLFPISNLPHPLSNLHFFGSTEFLSQLSACSMSHSRTRFCVGCSLDDQNAIPCRGRYFTLPLSSPPLCNGGEGRVVGYVSL